MASIHCPSICRPKMTRPDALSAAEFIKLKVPIGSFSRLTAFRPAAQMPALH